MPYQKSELCTSIHNNFQLNELQRLQEIQHPRIIQLLAFQENGLPQLYITEDYIEYNLQVRIFLFIFRLFMFK